MHVGTFFCSQKQLWSSNRNKSNNNKTQWKYIKDHCYEWLMFITILHHHDFSFRVGSRSTTLKKIKSVGHKIMNKHCLILLCSRLGDETMVCTIFLFNFYWCYLPTTNRSYHTWVRGYTMVLSGAYSWMSWEGQVNDGSSNRVDSVALSHLYIEPILANLIYASLITTHLIWI